MEELVTGDEAVLRAVALVVHNLRLDVEGLEDGEEPLDHAVTPDGAGDVDGGLLGLEDLQQVGLTREDLQLGSW